MQDDPNPDPETPARDLRQLSVGACTEGNGARYYSDEAVALDAIWQAIDRAELRVWIEIYIMEPDEVGRRTLQKLTAAARRGCDVVLVYDRFGSRNLRPRHLRDLRRFGGTAVAFNPISPWRGRRSLRFRTHRKMVIVDDTVGFCGGLNLSLAYSGVLSRKFLRKRHRVLQHLFDDTLVRLEGPCVADLGLLFSRTLAYVGPVVERTPFPPCPASRHPGIPVQILEHDPLDRPSTVERALIKAIEAAEETCYLSSPYFIPTDDLARALRDAAGRGVDVRVLTAGRTDIPFARLAARHGYGPFLADGVRVFEMYQRTLHSKTLVVDGCYTLVGSYNMDVWTSRHVLEVAAGMYDESIARACEAEFHQHAGMSLEITGDEWRARPWWRRLADRFFHWLATVG